MDRPTPDTAETQELLGRVREGDPSALGELMAHHRPYLQRIAALRLPDRIRPRLDGSDVVQEVQLEVARRIGEYAADSPLPFRLWLRRIAQDRMVMAYRRHVEAEKRSVEREIPLPDDSSYQLAQRLLGDGPTPSQALSRKHLVERVRRAVAALPEPEREIVLMRNFEALSNRAAARVLGVDPATSSRRYGRALLRLRDLLLEGGLGLSEVEQ